MPQLNSSADTSQRVQQTTEPKPGLALVQLADTPGATRWLQFDEPTRILQTSKLDEVVPYLEEVEAAVEQGLYAVGYLAYEAAPAFDPALSTHASCPLPLLWFGLYEQPKEVASVTNNGASHDTTVDWEPSASAEEYDQSIGRIKDYIASGDTYQVNYTMRLRSAFKDDPRAFFANLSTSQGAEYCAYIDMGEHIICSTSPELFFRLEGNRVTCRPMKGTAPRGRTMEQDVQRARWLEHSVKNRAENVMIVDMIRNDLGRIAHMGSVHVDTLFHVERYPTLFQMTSTVQAETDATVTDMMRAMFPCASVTGAPKVRTMEIIRELEPEPRGIYTGCVGFMMPNSPDGKQERYAQFNVAIRTVHIDRQSGEAAYGTGGGIVWDSIASSEYEECCTKALALTAKQHAFSLLETMKWTPDDGFYLVELHLQRLLDSACYFDVAVERGDIVRCLNEAAASFETRPQRVRVLVGQDGVIEIEATTLKACETAMAAGLARTPIDQDDLFLYHKTTRRSVYEKALLQRPDMTEVLLWNARNEITEFTTGNVAVEIGGTLYTPPITSGLLPGTFRQQMIQEGSLEERVIKRDEVPTCSAIYFMNSVRGLLPVDWKDA